MREFKKDIYSVKENHLKIGSTGRGGLSLLKRMSLVWRLFELEHRRREFLDKVVPLKRALCILISSYLKDDFSTPISREKRYHETNTGKPYCSWGIS